MHLAESSSTLFCLWTGLSLPVALHPASQRRSYLQLRTGQCSRPERTFTLLLVRTLRRTSPGPLGQRHDSTHIQAFGKCPNCGASSHADTFPYPPLRCGILARILTFEKKSCFSVDGSSSAGASGKESVSIKNFSYFSR